MRLCARARGREKEREREHAKGWLAALEIQEKSGVNGRDEEGKGETRDRCGGRVALFQSKNPFHSTSVPPDTV